MGKVSILTEGKIEIRSDHSSLSNQVNIKCIYLRMYSNMDTPRITALTEFNDFLLRNPLERAADVGIELLEERTLKPDGEDIANELPFSHAYFHLRNLLLNNDGGIAGIVDRGEFWMAFRYLEVSNGSVRYHFRKALLTKTMAGGGFTG